MLSTYVSLDRSFNVLFGIEEFPLGSSPEDKHHVKSNTHLNSEDAYSKTQLAFERSTFMGV